MWATIAAMDAPAAEPLARVTVPAKVILLGEHAVVYGYPAIAVPLASIGVDAAAWPSDDAFDHVHSTFPDGTVESLTVAAAPETAPTAVAARAAFEVWSQRLPPLAIALESTIPPGRGLGSSAAVAVAVVRVIAAAAGKAPSAPVVAELALAAERVVHGRPSGIDTATVAFERPIGFRGGAFGPTPVGAPLGLVVADSGAFSSTRAMVEAVAARRDADRTGTDAVLEGLGAAAARGGAALAAGDGPALGAAMNDAHGLLAELGVSTDALDALAAVARASGAFGAKLAGSGGGGVIVAVCPPAQAADVAAACRHAGATWVSSAVLSGDDRLDPRMRAPLGG